MQKTSNNMEISLKFKSKQIYLIQVVIISRLFKCLFKNIEDR